MTLNFDFEFYVHWCDLFNLEWHGHHDLSDFEWHWVFMHAHDIFGLNGHCNVIDSGSNYGASHFVFNLYDFILPLSHS